MKDKIVCVLGSSTDSTSFIFQLISIHLAWILQLLQLSLFFNQTIFSIVQTMVYAALPRNDLDLG
jgi:hypothetical protein